MKAQTTQEFLLILPLLFLLFAMYVLLFYYQSTIYVQAEEQARVRQLGQEVQGALNAVYLAGDGAAYNFSHPRSTSNVTLYAGIVQVHGPVAVLQYPLLTQQTPVTAINDTNFTIIQAGGQLVIG